MDNEMQQEPNQALIMIDSVSYMAQVVGSPAKGYDASVAVGKTMVTAQAGTRRGVLSTLEIKIKKQLTADRELAQARAKILAWNRGDFRPG